MATSLRILHFNDVYRVTPQKSPSGKISVTQFAHLFASLSKVSSHSAASERPLCLFSGDVFAPSVESTVTRGSHMVPVMNTFGLDAALTGNHDFDFGGASHTSQKYLVYFLQIQSINHVLLGQLVQDCNFPWLLSNIYDTNTGMVPDTLREFIVLKRSGLTIGIIGLVEKEWIDTVSSWPPNFKYKDMADVGINLSKKLRDGAGPCCDIVIALTHSRLPNDIALAKALYARASPIGDVVNNHGVDLILGGHDHLYYVSKGFQEWENYDMDHSVPLGAEDDDGVRVIKSGTDFRDLSELTLELQDGPLGAARRKYIKSVTGKRHTVTPDTKSSEEMHKVLTNLLSSVSSRLGSPVCKTTTPLDVRSELIRTGESAAANWFADVLLHAYDNALCMNGLGGADAVLICAGTLRGDSVYGPGIVTLGDILEILPFEDPIVVLELSGETIWEALESSLRTWPAQEGRFPVLSAFRVTWDSCKPPGQRVLDIWLERHNYDSENKLVKVKREPGQTYKVVTREYMAQGHDGFEALRGCKYLIDEEHGTLMSSLVRKYLLGSQYIYTMQQLSSTPTSEPHLHHETSNVISRARARWQSAGKHIISSRKHISEIHKDAYKVASREHMQCVDCLDGGATRRGGGMVLSEKLSDVDGIMKDLTVIGPEVDGRLRNRA